MKPVKKILRTIRGVSTPIGGVSWEHEWADDKIVDIHFPQKSGLEEELYNAGYKIAWSAEKKLSTRIDLEGWEKVVWEDKAGKQFILKCFDGLTLIMKERDST